MSQATAKKSENISSPIGRRPVIAAPITAPTIACSLMGVSRTRSAPNRAKSPSVVLNTPPAAPTSSPMNTTDRVALHLLGDAGGHGLAIRQFRHEEPPSAQTCVIERLGVGFRRGAGDRLGIGDGGGGRGLDAVDSPRPRRRPGGGPGRPGSGSRASHALTSSSGRYLPGSAREWPPWRYVRASMSDGPSPLRARSMAVSGDVMHGSDVVAVDDERLEAVGRGTIGGRPLDRGHLTDRACTPCTGCSRRRRRPAPSRPPPG